MAFSNQHLVCVECEKSGLSVTVVVIFDQPRIAGMPQRWEAQKPILPATNSSAASVGQGTVNCPDVTVMLAWSALMTSYKPHRLVRVVFDHGSTSV